jgi:biotin carboxyl carrier protein
MKVTLQEHQIQLEKTNGQWTIPHNAEINLHPTSKNILLVQTPTQTLQLHCVSVDKTAKTVTILYNNQKYTAKITEPLDDLLKSMGLENALTPKISEIKAPMPGLVLNIAVSVGDAVEVNQKVLTLEAMKMENAIKSPTAGIIAAIEVSSGQAVDKNQVLIRFE